MILEAKQINLNSADYSSEDSDYDKMTELDWAEYQFATIEYDYNIHPQAANAIRAIFKQLSKG